MSRLALAQEGLSQEFEKAMTLGGKPDVQLPQASRPIEPGHELGNVTGTDITMKVYDHAVAGAINGAVAWGFFDEASGIAKLIIRKYGETISAEFKRQPDKSLGGVISSGDASSPRSTSVFFTGADPAARTFKLRINDEEIVVLITPEGTSNGHFVNPTFSTVIGGKPVSYKIDAEGCFGYSINMGMIILGAYSH
jgi:hypothetical protein